MNIKKIACAAAVCGCVSLATAADEVAEAEKGEVEWAICDHVALTAYIAYSDYWFDSKLRHGAREYNGAWSHGSKYADSWNFYGGVGVTVSF